MKTLRVSLLIAVVTASMACYVPVPAANAQGVLLSGELVEGTILSADDSDNWTLSSGSGDAIVVRMGETVSGSSLSPYLRIYDPAGTLKESNSGSEEAEVSVNAGIAGTYLIVASEALGGVTGSGDYRITLATNGTAVTVSPGDEGGSLTIGAMHTGTVLVGDLDLWTVSAQGGDAIVVRMGETVSGSSLSPYLRIYGPAGTLMESNSGSEEAEVSVNAGIAGTYLIVASEALGGVTGSGDYWITQVGTSAVATTPPSVDFRLAPATPNPFVTRTTLAYHVPGPGHALLQVFDSQGRLVRTLLDEITTASGTHEVSWDGRDMTGREMAQGLYFACLEASGRRMTRKVLLTR